MIGPNGSGKTTLLEILAGNEGAGCRTRALRKQTRLAYVPQDSRFEPDDTVDSVLQAALEALPLEDDEARSRDVMLGRAGFETPPRRPRRYPADGRSGSPLRRRW